MKLWWKAVHSIWYTPGLRFLPDRFSCRCSSSLSPPSEVEVTSKDYNFQSSYSVSKIIEKTNTLYDETKKQQLSKLVPRIEKIEVQFQGRGISDNAVMFMNRHLSTPYHCAQHISKTVADSAVLAIVTPTQENDMLMSQNQIIKGTELVAHSHDENTVAQSFLWDMHRPLPCDCKLQILKFNMENSTQWHHDEVNKAYWNSCAMLLGNVVAEAFKENYSIGLHKYPFISVNRGAFCYDILLDERLKDWEAMDKDLIYFTKLARSIVSKNLKFERLDVSSQQALEMFRDDPFRSRRIEDIIESQGGDALITLYRIGKHIDISSGPHISNTSLIYHYVITAIHNVCTNPNGTTLRRFQGLSLPKDLRVHHAVWSMLENRARKLVKQNLKLNNVHNTQREDAPTPFDSIENKTKRYTLSYKQWREGEWKDTEESFKTKK